MELKWKVGLEKSVGNADNGYQISSFTQNALIAMW